MTNTPYRDSRGPNGCGGCLMLMIYLALTVWIAYLGIFTFLVERKGQDHHGNTKGFLWGFVAWFAVTAFVGYLSARSGRRKHGNWHDHGPLDRAMSRLRGERRQDISRHDDWS